MMNGDFISEEEAKKLAAGPLGKKMAEFPLLFSHPVFFCQRPSKDKKTTIRNGSVSLIDFGKGPVAVTCQHVIEGYRKYLNQYDNTVFHIGFYEIDPLKQLIDECRESDIAIIGLKEEQIKSITSQGKFGSSIFTPVEWPSKPPEQDEYIVFGGYPGSMREIESYNEVVFRTWSCGATKIDAANHQRYICPFERDYWVKAYGNDEYFELKDLGGMSGGPAFIQRGLKFDFIGIVSEYQENLDTMIFSSALLISNEGKIIKNV